MDFFFFFLMNQLYAIDKKLTLEPKNIKRLKVKGWKREQL